MTQAQRKRKERNKRAKEGYVRMELWTLKQFREQIKKFVQRLHG